MNYDLDMPGYVQDMAGWLDDDSRIHPCNFESAYKGFEIIVAMMRSVIEGGQIALPLADPANELEMLKKKLPDISVLLSFPGNAKEYV
jgi:hypothetical protein